MSFETLGLKPAFLRGVENLGYRDPTPIQQQAIPVVLQGGDVMGLAQTGTGKTAAFVLPMLQRLSESPKGGVRALIITPTRELADQVEEAVRRLGQGTGLSSMTVYGGVGMQPQVDGLRRGRDIVVACPGRLLDHIQQGNADLSKVGILVLDEADQMLDMGFFPTVRRILAALPKQRQNLLFSATMPDDVRHLAEEILNRPATVQVGRSAPVETVSHALYPVAHHLKTSLLKAILARTDTESVLVFTRTKYRAKRVAQQLIADGFRAAELQGNLSQTRRQAALGGFRDGSVQILVATDIAARGIDVTQISHVINYDIPDTVEAYTHRIGRTGRAAKTGDAYTFVEPVDADMVRGIERVLRQSIPRLTLEGFDYAVPAPRKDTEFARPPREPRGPGKARRPADQAGGGRPPAPAPRQVLEGHRAPHRGPEAWIDPDARAGAGQRGPAGRPGEGRPGAGGRSGDGGRPNRDDRAGRGGRPGDRNDNSRGSGRPPGGSGDTRRQDGGGERPGRPGGDGGRREGGPAQGGSRDLPAVPERRWPEREERPKPVLDKERFRLRPEDRPQPARPAGQGGGGSGEGGSGHLRLVTIDERDDSWKRGEDPRETRPSPEERAERGGTGDRDRGPDEGRPAAAERPEASGRPDAPGERREAGGRPSDGGQGRDRDGGPRRRRRRGGRGGGGRDRKSVV